MFGIHSQKCVPNACVLEFYSKLWKLLYTKFTLKFMKNEDMSESKQPLLQDSALV